MAARSCLQTLCGGTFVLVVFALLGLCYYLFVFHLYLPLSHCILHTADYTAKWILLGFHFLLFMQLWSLIGTMTTDPGIVPPYWGFYMGDAEAKRRRYCLMCHVFKPERCHHCSICNRCVLNMDHHCRTSHSAWINNCVGFHNRKLFIQLLTYSLLLIYYVVVTVFPHAYDTLRTLSQGKNVEMESMLLVGFWVFVALLALVLTSFYRFHIQLVLSNSTTIENLEQAEGEIVLKYDQGRQLNWMQVFGRNPWLWVVPLYGKSGKPLGDGVSWVTEKMQPQGQVEDEGADSARHTVESPRPSPPIHSRRRMPSPVKDSDLSPEHTEEQNHSSVLLVNLSNKPARGEDSTKPGRHSDVDTDSSFLTNHHPKSVQPDDSYMREVTGKQEAAAVLEISLRDEAMFSMAKLETDKE